MTNPVQAWLNIQCQTIEGVRHAVLLLIDADSDGLIPIAQCPGGHRAPTELIPIARIALDRKQAAVNAQISGNDAEDSAFDYIALPIFSGSRLIGVIAVKMVHRANEERQAVTLRLETGLKWLVLTQLQRATSESGFYASVLQLLARCFESKTFEAVLTTLVNHLATELNCERVSFGIVKNQCCRVIALSNSARFDTRSKLIRKISEAMDEALDQDAILLFPDPGRNFGWIVTRKHQDLAREFGSRAVCTIPLAHESSMFGAVTLETSDERGFDADRVRFCELTLVLLTPFLVLQKSEEAGFAEKFRAAFTSGTHRIVGPENAGSKFGILGLVLLLVFTAYFKTEFRVKADAALEGQVQRIVAASIDGFVAASHFRAGESVGKGDVLATLDSRDLALELVKLASEQQQHNREYREALANGDRVQVRVTGARIAQVEARMQLVREQLARTRILAPFDGVIIEGDLSQSLGSPVERGETLFKVAPLDNYRIVLRVDEREIAYVKKGQTGALALSSLPGRRIPLVIEKLTPVTRAESGYNAFRVEAVLQESDRVLRPGMQGIAKINVGQASLLWIWSHEITDWLRLKLWSWWN